MLEIKTEIEIEASPKTVWEIISNIEEWEKWSPIIKKSSGKPIKGSEIEITMAGKDSDTDGPTYKPEIINLYPSKYFQWRAHMLAGFLFTNDKIFELEETSAGTMVIHKETFSGLLVPIFCKKMEKGVRPMLDSMNQSLKKLAENK